MNSLLKKIFCKEDDVHLLLPETVYACPGLECSIYFDNIVTVLNIRNYVFAVSCEVGRTDQKRWRFLPTEAQCCIYEWTVKVITQTGVAATGRTRIKVVPRIPEKNVKMSLLIFGDSQTAPRAGEGYPERLHQLMREGKNIDFSMVGTNSTGYSKPVPGGVAHEGYGGWVWATFFTRANIIESDQNDGLDPQRPWLTNSRFLFPQEDGTYLFSFKKYCEVFNHGNIPDTVVVMLGTNSIFYAGNLADLGSAWKQGIFPYVRRLVTELRAVSPGIHIAFSTLITGAASQDAFGARHQCRQNRWQWRQNLDFYHRKLMQAAGKLQVEIIPSFVAVDGEHGYPTAEEEIMQGCADTEFRQIDAIHPSQDGHRQLGNAVYCYLADVLYRRSTAPAAGESPDPKKS